MDRKSRHAYTWPYTYPPFPPTPAWFSLNGVTYHQVFPGSGGSGPEHVGMAGGVFPCHFVDPRGMPGPRHQSEQQTQQEANSGNSSHTDASTAAAAAAATAAVSQRTQSASAGDNASSASTGPSYYTTNSNNSVLVPSRPSSPMTVDAAMQCLSGQLHDAIQLCTESLAAHAEVMATAHFTSVATRNSIWRDLLEHRLKASAFAHDGFRNLGQRLAFYMEQAQAAQNDPAVASGDQMRRREAERRVRILRVLRVECEEVVSLSAGASRDVLDCREMLGLMIDVKTKLGARRSGVKQREQQEQHEDAEEKQEEDIEEGESEGDNSGMAMPTVPW
ncbi:unnamed protein product [Discula destructiva]